MRSVQLNQPKQFNDHYSENLIGFVNQVPQAPIAKRLSYYNSSNQNQDSESKGQRAKSSCPTYMRIIQQHPQGMSSLSPKDLQKQTLVISNVKKVQDGKSAKPKLKIKSNMQSQEEHKLQSFKKTKIKVVKLDNIAEEKSYRHQTIEAPNFHQCYPMINQHKLQQLNQFFCVQGSNSMKQGKGSSLMESGGTNFKMSYDRVGRTIDTSTKSSQKPTIEIASARSDSVSSNSSSLDRDDTAMLSDFDPQVIQSALPLSMFESIDPSSKKLQNNITIKIEQFSSVKIVKADKQRQGQAGEIEDIIRQKKQRLRVLSNEVLMKSIKYIVKHLTISDSNKLGIMLSSNSLRLLHQQFMLGLSYSLFSRPNSINEIVTHWKSIHKPKIIDIGLSSYYTQISSVNSEFDFEIEKDIERTFPGDKSFNIGKPQYKQLFRILRAAAYHLPQVGYVQGFNFIAGSLLQLIKNEQLAFWTFLQVLEWRQIFSMYSEGMPKLKLLSFQLNCFIQNLLPELDLYFTKRSISVELFSFQWLLTLFSFEFGLTFFTVFLYTLFQQGQRFFIQISLALLETMKLDLLVIADMEEAMAYIKDFPKQVHATTTMKAVFKRALQMKEVSEKRLLELEGLFKQQKNTKRILFVKEGNKDTERTEKTYIKTLPNLPDDDEYTQQQHKDEDNSSSGNIQDYGLEITHTPSISKSAQSLVPRKMDAPITALRNNEISTYSAVSLRKQDSSPNQVSSSHNSNQNRIHTMSFPNQSRLLQVPIATVNLTKAQNRSPNKQNVIFEQQSPRNFKIETPRSEEIEEDSDRVPASVLGKIKPLGKELSKLFDQGNKELSVFQSPMVQYTNRSNVIINSHLVQQERKINNPLSSTAKLLSQNIFNHENSENIDPNTVRNGIRGSRPQIPQYMESNRRSPTPCLAEHKFSATQKLKPLSYLQQQPSSSQTALISHNTSLHVKGKMMSSFDHKSKVQSPRNLLFGTIKHSTKLNFLQGDSEEAFSLINSKARLESARDRVKPTRNKTMR